MNDWQAEADLNEVESWLCAEHETARAGCHGCFVWASIRLLGYEIETETETVRMLRKEMRRRLRLVRFAHLLSLRKSRKMNLTEKAERLPFPISRSRQGNGASITR